MNAYAPRRQNKRWLNADCPREVLAIYDDKREPVDRFTIFYATVLGEGSRQSLTYVGLSESGQGYHGELKVGQAAEFRFRNAHRACRWSDLPLPVRNWIRRDLQDTRDAEAQ